MNRHERRKAASQARRSAKTGEVPEAYHKAITDAARLIAQWVQAEPVKPALRWLPQKEDGVFIAAALDAGAAYLADSPDAFRLLAWLDEQTGRQLSLNQTTWALRLCRALPMPDGSYYGVETVRQSQAQKGIDTFVRDFGKEETRVQGSASACPRCGTANDAATGVESGERPRPGDLAVCTTCLAVNAFDIDLRVVGVTEEQFAALPAPTRAHLEDMQALLRAARLRGDRKGPVGEA